MKNENMKEIISQIKNENISILDKINKIIKKLNDSFLSYEDKNMLFLENIKDKDFFELNEIKQNPFTPNSIGVISSFFLEYFLSNNIIFNGGVISKNVPVFDLTYGTGNMLNQFLSRKITNVNFSPFYLDIAESYTKNSTIKNVVFPFEISEEDKEYIYENSIFFKIDKKDFYKLDFSKDNLKISLFEDNEIFKIKIENIKNNKLVVLKSDLINELCNEIFHKDKIKDNFIFDIYINEDSFEVFFKVSFKKGEIKEKSIETKHNLNVVITPDNNIEKIKKNFNFNFLSPYNFENIIKTKSKGVEIEPSEAIVLLDLPVNDLITNNTVKMDEKIFRNINEYLNSLKNKTRLFIIYSRLEPNSLRNVLEDKYINFSLRFNKNFQPLTDTDMYLYFISNCEIDKKLISNKNQDMDSFLDICKDINYLKSKLAIDFNKVGINDKNSKYVTLVNDFFTEIEWKYSNCIELNNDFYLILDDVVYFFKIEDDKFTTLKELDCSCSVAESINKFKYQKNEFKVKIDDLKNLNMKIKDLTIDNLYEIYSLLHEEVR